MSALQHTPVDTIAKVHATLKASFRAGTTRPLPYRRTQLLQLARLVQDNADALRAALHADLHKQPLEVDMSELAPIVRGCLHAADSLEQWAAPDVPQVEAWKSSWNAKLFKAPKGVALIISSVSSVLFICQSLSAPSADPGITL